MSEVDTGVETSLILPIYEDTLTGLPYPVCVRNSAVKFTLRYKDGELENSICIPQLDDFIAALTDAICKFPFRLLKEELGFLLRANGINVMTFIDHLRDSHPDYADPATPVFISLENPELLPEAIDVEIRKYIKYSQKNSADKNYEDFTWEGMPKKIEDRDPETVPIITAELVFPEGKFLSPSDPFVVKKWMVSVSNPTNLEDDSDL